MKKSADFRILVIDDNPAIHNDFIKILSSTNDTTNLDNLSHLMFGTKRKQENPLPLFQIDTATQGLEGIKMIEEGLEQGARYSLAFIDVRMPPGLDGIETAQRIWEIDKDIQLVICTAYSDYSWEDTIANLGQTDNLLILKKPFDNISVRQLAFALTKKWNLLLETRNQTLSLMDQVSNKTVSLEKSLSLVKATLESSDEGIVVINNEDKIVEFNQRFVEMWRLKSEDMKTLDYQQLMRLMSKHILDEKTVEQLKNINNLGDTKRIDEIQLKDGLIFDCYAQTQMMNEEVIGIVLNFRDITQKSCLEKQLLHQAKHDSLTNLPNRVLLNEKLEELISKKKPFALIFVDLDRFKLINDSLGHKAGDELLVQVVKCLQKEIRIDDLLVRFGGDEFVIVLPGVSTNDDVKNKLDKLIKSLQSPIVVADHEISITGSFGVCLYPHNGATADDLLRNADSAMYTAKKEHTHNYHTYSQKMSDECVADFENEIALKHALTHHEFTIYYQPQFDVVTGQISALEALLRWNHPQLGLLTPIDFIPLAEETGLIIPIGQWVMRSVCEQIKAWTKAGFKPLRVAVNISKQEIAQNNIVEILRTILRETGINPQYFELEFTENMLIGQQNVIDTLMELKKLGIRISIDDFGSGYSILGYLDKLSLDRLNIDRSFIQSIQTSSDKEVIIKAIIALAKNLNMQVVAEGVETTEQLEFLKTQECVNVQGYLYSEPLSVKEIEKLIKEKNDSESVRDYSDINS